MTTRSWVQVGVVALLWGVYTTFKVMEIEVPPGLYEIALVGAGSFLPGAVRGGGG